MRHVLSTLPVVAALLVVAVGNLPKSTRVRQYPMPFAAAMYAIVALILLYRFNTWIDDILRAVFSIVPLLREWYDTTWEYVIENTVVVLVFLVVKLLLRRLFDRVFEGEDFPGSGLVQGVYRYDSELGIWCVRPHNAGLRVYLRVFYWSSLVAVVGFMLLVSMFPAWPGFAAIAFPALAALVIGECYFAIDGITGREFRHDILGEQDDAERITNYAGLRDVLKETFPDRVIDDGVRFASVDATRTFERLDALAHSPDEVDRVAAGYFDRLKQSGRTLDVNLVGAAADLMRGRSTLVSNPFYGDLTPYLVFPAYYHLLQYNRCLLICGRDAIAKDLVAWLDDGLESISGVPDLWRVGLLGEQDQPDLDVGVIRFADIHNLDLIRANDDFLRDVRYVILAEPSRILATGQLGLGLLLSRCGDATRPVFAAFDRNHDGLVDALSHLLKTDLTDVVAAAVPHGVSSEMVWRADGPHLHATVLPSVSRYLGMGTEIGAVALKYQVSHVDWVGSDAFPVNDMMWIAGQYYSQINALADIDVSQHALGESIRPQSNPWMLPQEKARFLVVEDEIHNVHEAIRLYATRAEQQGFVNVISEDYLLRDYMIGNGQIFSADPKAIPSIVPDYARTERNLVLRLVLALRTFGLTESALAREFELIGHLLPAVLPPRADDRDEDEYEAPVIALLRGLVETHTGIASVHLVKELVPEGLTTTGTQVLARRYRLQTSESMAELEQSLRAAYFFVEDEVENKEYIGAALHGLVYQTMMPGQFITHAGKYYEVQSIGDDIRRNGVVLRRAAEHIRDRRVYRQMRTFTITDVRVSDRTGSRVVVNGITLTRAFANIEVQSHGYIELQTRSDLAGGRETTVSNVPRRHYTHKELLQIELPDVEPAVRATIAVLLNELFVTVFPDSHHYVTALTADDAGRFRPLLDGLELDAESDAIFIVEDSLIDLGLLVAVERNWRRLFEIVTDYLLWQTTAQPGSDEPQAATAYVAVFPDDSPEEVAERARVAAEQDAAHVRPARPPARAPWWRRAADRVRGWFTRGAKDDVAEVVEPAAPDVEPLESAPVEIDSEVEFEVESASASEVESEVEAASEVEETVEEEPAPSSPFLVDLSDEAIAIDYENAAADPAESVVPAPTKAAPQEDTNDRQ